MLRRLLRLSGVLGPAVTVGMAGCSAGRSGNAEVHLRPSAIPYEADIPLPEGFRLADRSSEDWANASVRYVRHRYRGEADIRALRRFYRNQMPLVRWTEVSSGLVNGRCTMRFERKDESCTILIEDAPSGWSRGVVVDVIITPAS